jgi:hypothetical protein
MSVAHPLDIQFIGDILEALALGMDVTFTAYPGIVDTWKKGC